MADQPCILAAQHSPERGPCPECGWEPAPVCMKCKGPCEPDRMYCELCRGFEHEDDTCLT